MLGNRSGTEKANEANRKSPVVQTVLFQVQLAAVGGPTHDDQKVLVRVQPIERNNQPQHTVRAVSRS